MPASIRRQAARVMGGSMALAVLSGLLSCGARPNVPAAQPARMRDSLGRVTEAYMARQEWWNRPPRSAEHYAYAVGTSGQGKDAAADAARRELAKQQGVRVQGIVDTWELDTSEEYRIEVRTKRVLEYGAQLPDSGVRAYGFDNGLHHALIEVNMADFRRLADRNRGEVLNSLNDARRMKAVGNIRGSLRAYLHALELAFERIEGSEADWTGGDTGARLSETLEIELQALVSDVVLVPHGGGQKAMLGEGLPQPLTVVPMIEGRPAQGLDVEFCLRGGRAGLSPASGGSSTEAAFRTRTDVYGRASCLVSALSFL
ncbi:hypothetical protein HOI71_18100, partial [Candidatus Poribacteria bacterium]|nr:hypothetical protein [Candidatus Poribacteria bacterium]